MTGLEALDGLILTLKNVIKVCPANELPGLSAAIEMAEAVRQDVDEHDQV